jgi:hypothetical protein
VEILAAAGTLQVEVGIGSSAAIRQEEGMACLAWEDRLGKEALAYLVPEGEVSFLVAYQAYPA